MRFPETYPIVDDWTSKQQVVKMFEEVAELLEAIKNDPEHAIEEAADLLQVFSGLCEIQGWEEKNLQSAYDKVFMKNWERGYYDGMDGGTLYDHAEQHYKELMS